MHLPTPLNEQSDPCPVSKPGRRKWLGAALGGALCCVTGVGRPAPAQANVQAQAHAHAHGQASSSRLALLIGNADYPAPHDLPPIHKNVMDLSDALAARGFEVTEAMNLNETGLLATVREFVRQVAQAPADATTLFYYAGHGLQVDANNLLLGCGVNPRGPRKELLANSLVLQHQLLAQLPARPKALNMLVIDACRTDLRHAFGDQDGFNQVEAPLGGLVCFSTDAGRPAVSPDRPDQNTFYTASLVKLLRQAPAHTTFNDLFRLVKQDVEQTMRAHPVAAIRQLAQRPFIADNAAVQVPLGVTAAHQQAQALVDAMQSDAELRAWQAVQQATWPLDVIARSRQYLDEFEHGAQVDLAKLYMAGAQEAMRLLRAKSVGLYKTSFISPTHDHAELHRAARGDKDAAARIARQHRNEGGERGLLRYAGWLQFASALGNGIASYELALLYRETGQAVLAAQAEARALELGYRPPRSLSHERK